MTAKLTYFAHPRGWHKGSAMHLTTSPGGAPAVAPVRGTFADLLGHSTEAPFLAFTSEAFRAQWLKWWSKP